MTTVKRHQHCNLCKHVDARLSDGIYCDLTGKRPSFHGTCTTFILSTFSKHVLKELKDDLSEVEERRERFKNTFYLLFILGTLIVLFGYFLFKLKHQSMYATYHALGFCAGGLTLWAVAIKHRAELIRKKNQIENRIDDFEIVLRLYK